MADDQQIEPGYSSVVALALGIIERMGLANLRRLSLDSTGRLRVGDATITSGTITTVTTVTTLTNLTNWGLLTAIPKSQLEANQAYQQGFRRNLVVS